MTSPDAEGSNSGGKPLKIKGTLSVLLVFGFINLFAVGAVVCWRLLRVQGYSVNKSNPESTAAWNRRP